LKLDSFSLISHLLPGKGHLLRNLRISGVTGVEKVHSILKVSIDSNVALRYRRGGVWIQVISPIFVRLHLIAVSISWSNWNGGHLELIGSN